MTDITQAKSFMDNTLANMLSTGKLKTTEYNAFIEMSEKAYDEAYYYEVLYPGNTGYLYFQYMFAYMNSVSVSNNDAKNDLERLADIINSEIISSGNEGYTLNLLVETTENMYDDANEAVSTVAETISNTTETVKNNPKKIAIGIGVAIGLLLVLKGAL